MSSNFANIQAWVGDLTAQRKQELREKIIQKFSKAINRQFAIGPTSASDAWITIYVSKLFTLKLKGVIAFGKKLCGDIGRPIVSIKVSQDQNFSHISLFEFCDVVDQFASRMNVQSPNDDFFDDKNSTLNNGDSSYWVRYYQKTGVNKLFQAVRNEGDSKLDAIFSEAVGSATDETAQFKKLFRFLISVPFDQEKKRILYLCELFGLNATFASSDFDGVTSAQRVFPEFYGFQRGTDEII